MKASETQIGGNHYKKLAIQPIEYSMANRLDATLYTPADIGKEGGE